MSSAASRFPNDRVRWAFFLFLAASVLLVIYADERFLIDFRDQEWKRIAPFKWLLLVHQARRRAFEVSFARRRSRAG
jgi:hypothetical protein